MADRILVVLDNNQIELGFNEIIIRRAIDEISGSFSLSTVATLKDFPIKEGMKCQIFANGESVLNGYIEKIQINYDNVKHTIFIQGRDKTADLIDSDIDTGNFSVDNDINLKQLIEIVLKNLNINDIKVINTVNDSSVNKVFDNAADDVGSKALDYLNKYAAMRQVLLQTDGKGNIIIARASQEDSGGRIKNSLTNRQLNNVLNASALLDSSEVYHKYIVHSQQNTIYLKAELESVSNSANTNSSIIDPNIRVSRIKSMLADTSSDSEVCLERAKWDKNIRIANSKVYQYRLSGFESSPGKIWKTNQLVQVKDDFFDLDAQLLIKYVEFTQTEKEGSKTQLTLISPESYTLQEKLNKSYADSSKISVNYLKDPIETKEENEQKIKEFKFNTTRFGDLI